MPPGEQPGTAPRDVALLDLTLTPHGHLFLTESKDAPALDRAPADRLRQAFASGPGGGLLQLGAGEVQTPLPPTFGYWREFSARYVTALCAHPEAAGAAPSAAAPGPLPCTDEADLDGIVAAAPPRPKRARACGKKADKAPKKRKLSAAQRRAISERMRRYWEARCRG